MKLKFAGIIRSLLGQGGNNSLARPVASSQAAIQSTTTATQNYAEQASGSPGYDPSLDPSASEVPRNPDEIGIPLAAIVNALPLDLKAKLIGSPAPGKMVYLRIENVISQLAFGAVKITFGELRQLAPGTFVNGINSAFDGRQINLPLNEILSRISPSLLSRRTPAQKYEVAEDISGPFGGQCRGVSFTAQPLKGPPATSVAPPRAVKPPQATPPSRETKPAKPVNFVPPASPTAPPLSAPRQVPQTPVRPAKSEPIAFTQRQPTPMAPPVPFAEPSKPALSGSSSNGTGNGNGIENGNGNGKTVSPLPPFKFTVAQPPPPAAHVSPPAAAPAPLPAPASEPQPSFNVMLRDLAENWPNEMKTEIVQIGFVNASVPLPIPLIEPSLKRGRVTMAWRDLRALIKPNSLPSPCDDLELDLPLKVLAPAFLAAQKKLASQSQAKIAVSEEIPNLFFGFPQPETAAPPTPPAFRPPHLPTSTVAPVEPSLPVVQQSTQTNSTRITDTNLFAPSAGNSPAENDSTLFQRNPVPATDFMSRQMQPKDVVAQALALPGVAGAVVALADGLRVAGDVPPEFNADTVAAFLPQIYERVNQSTRELRMGALNNVSFTVGSVPWKIFRVNSIYFATFGRAGETFPKAQLAMLAAGLDRKTK